MWPRTRLPFCAAQLKIRSPLVKLNWPWFGSVASDFISFSAVTMLNSRFAIVVYAESPSLPAAMAVPKYRPLCAAAAPSVVAAPAGRRDQRDADRGEDADRAGDESAAQQGT